MPTRLVDLKWYVSTLSEGSGGSPSYGTPVPSGAAGANYRRLEVQSRDIGGPAQDLRTDRDWLGSGGFARTFMVDRWTGEMTFSVPAFVDLLTVLLPVSLGREPSNPTLVQTGVYDHFLFEKDFSLGDIQLPSFTSVLIGGDVDEVRAGCVVREWSLRGAPGLSTVEFNATIAYNGKIQKTSDVAGITKNDLLNLSIPSLKLLASADAVLKINGTDIVPDKIISEWTLTFRNEMLDDEAHPFGAPAQDSTNPLSGPVRQRHETTLQTAEITFISRYRTASQFLSQFKNLQNASFNVKLKGKQIAGSSPTAHYELEINAPTLIYLGWREEDRAGLVVENVRWQAGYSEDVFPGFTPAQKGAIAIRIRETTATKFMQPAS
ncbi:MAG: hypothetical protein V2G41_09320 [bacterium JZ-2024 1]